MRGLTEVDEHLAVTLPHVLGHGEDAGHVVVQERVLLLCTQTQKLHIFSLINTMLQ